MAGLLQILGMFGSSGNCPETKSSCLLVYFYVVIDILEEKYVSFWKIVTKIKA
jgi:hypothetical protein